MGELIFIIVIIAYIIKAASKAEENQKRQSNANKNPWDGVVYQAPKQATRQTSPRTQVQQQNTQWQKLAQENVAKARQFATEKLREIERDVVTELHSTTMSQTGQKSANRSAMQQVQEARAEARNTTILQRAKVNANEDKVDITLETMEAEHNHSERVSPAVHHHPEDVMPESMLGTIEDLMIKGYDGNLCFERDFVGEGLDMISRFTVPSDIPDFSSNHVA